MKLTVELHGIDPVKGEWFRISRVRKSRCSAEQKSFCKKLTDEAKKYYLRDKSIYLNMVNYWECLVIICRSET